MLVVASGETERRALPELLRHLVGDPVESLDVRIPPHGSLTIGQAAKLVRAGWWEAHGRGQPLDKVIVLVDADGDTPEDKVAAFDPLAPQVADLPVALRVTAAKWHLEAWFFADAINLRQWFGGKALGPVEVPADNIQSPKHRLRNLLSQPYTARTAGAIAAALSAANIRNCSPSFAKFEAAVKNGDQPLEPKSATG